MSLGIKSPTDGAPEVVNGDSVKTDAPPRAQPDPVVEQVNNVINSEVSGWERESLKFVNILSDWSTDATQSTEAEHRLCKGRRNALQLN